MAKFLIQVPILVHVSCEIEADSEEDAMDKAQDVYDFALEYKQIFSNKYIGAKSDDLDIKIASEPFNLTYFDAKVIKLKDINKN